LNLLKVWRLSVIFLCCWIPATLLASTAQDLLAGFSEVYELDAERSDTLGSVYILEDAAMNLSENDALAMFLRKDPKVVLQSRANLGLQTNAHWFFVILRSSHEQPQPVVLSNNSALVDFIDAYFFDSQLRLLKKEVSGDNRPISARQIQSAKPAFGITLPPDEKIAALFRVETRGSLIFQMEVRPLNQHINHISRELLFLSLYFGLMIMMIIYHTFMFGKLWELANLYYGGYLIFFGLFQAGLSGLGYEFIWGSYPIISQYSIPTCAYIGMIFATEFSISYLRLIEYSRAAWLFGRGLQITALIGISFVFIVGYEKNIAVVSVAAIVNFCFFLRIGYHGCRLGLRPAYYFMGAWSVFSISIIVLALRNFGLVPNHFLITYGNYIGSGLEIILLSLGVTDRIQEERRARMLAKEEALQVAEKSRLDLERRNLSFERFVPHDMIAMLGKQDIEEVELGLLREKELTFLFCDIRSYTQISETMSPAQNFAFLQAFYQLIAPVIRRHQGMIDKYIGDAILAVFDGPPDAALAAALELFEKLEEFNRHNRWTAQPVKIGCGVHHGPAVLGIIGETSRMEGTVIGDAVNLAARLEKLTKTRGARILTSRETITALPAQASIQSRCIGRTKVEGKRQVVELYEILNLDSPALRLGKIHHLTKFEAILHLWEEEQYEAAAAQLDDYLQLLPEDTVAQNMQRDIRRRVSRQSA
jgi:adenylate cyclase